MSHYSVCTGLCHLNSVEVMFTFVGFWCVTILPTYRPRSLQPRSMNGLYPTCNDSLALQVIIQAVFAPLTANARVFNASKPVYCRSLASKVSR
jgi:hypothetical protein